MAFKRSPMWKTEGFPAWLANELEARDWSLSEMARRVDTQPSVVSRWMMGHFTPESEYALKIAEAFGIDHETVLIHTGGLRPTDGDEVDPRKRALIALLRQIDVDDERYGIIRTMLDMMRRYPRAPLLAAL